MSAEPVVLKTYNASTPPSNNNHEPDKKGKKPTANEHIKVIGVGGGGSNAVDHIIRAGITGVDFLTLNTDVRSLEKSLAKEKIILGKKLTRGLGAGSKPEVGAAAAVESKEEIRRQLKGYDMVYLAAGMGGGTGTGALPVIANLAKEMGILTVAVVTKPFTFEGRRKMLLALEGIRELEGVVDALIIVPNDKLLSITEKNTSLAEAFAAVDNILRQAVQGVTDLITCPGSINVDFADLCTVMKGAGSAVMGIGTGKGENRAQTALKQALESPLMESSIAGAKGILFNITGGHDISIIEVSEAANILQDYVDMDARFIWGWVPDDRTDGSMEMVIIATGFNKNNSVNTVANPVNNAQTETDSTTPPAEKATAGERLTEDSILFGTGGDLFDVPSINRRSKQ